MNNRTISMKHSKSEQVYDWVTRKIFTREFLPGQRLVAREIAGQLELSKTPVREALLRIREDGLVQGDFNTGVFVAHITPKDALEIIDIREMLEGLAARLAAEKAKEEDIVQLRAILDKMEEYSKKDLIEAYADHDMQFHDAVVQIGESNRLQEILHKIRMQSKLLMSTTMKLPTRGMTASLNEHTSVWKAISLHDPKGAEAAARRHVLATREAAKKWLEVLL